MTRKKRTTWFAGLGEEIRKGRMLCSRCDVEKKPHSYTKERWFSEEPICNVCLKKEANAMGSRQAFLQRRDEARVSYCNRWEGEWLVKTCVRYGESCGACYTEGPDRLPHCFVEPVPNAPGSLRAINCQSTAGYSTFSAGGSFRHRGAE